jgi:hypothetical protein
MARGRGRAPPGREKRPGGGADLNISKGRNTAIIADSRESAQGRVRRALLVKALCRMGPPWVDMMLITLQHMPVLADDDLILLLETIVPAEAIGWRAGGGGHDA